LPFVLFLDHHRDADEQRLVQRAQLCHGWLRRDRSANCAF